MDIEVYTLVDIVIHLHCQEEEESEQQLFCRSAIVFISFVTLINLPYLYWIFWVFSSNLIDEKLWIAHRLSIPYSYEKSLQFFKAIKVKVSKEFKRNLFCSPSHLSSFSQQIKISNALCLLLLSLIWDKLLSGGFMGCCVKSFRQVNKKCPRCIKTIIHTLANVICNFKP